MIAARYSKITLLFICTAYLFMVVVNNLEDYSSNFAYVRSFLSMNDIKNNPHILYRSIQIPWVHHAFLVAIILWESIACAMCAIGCYQLFTHRKHSSSTFNQAKKHGIIGLTLGISLWFFAFFVVGGEFFLMWQSVQYNGLEAASRVCNLLGINLIYLCLSDKA
ncbi:MAG: DUF2165 family protein [Chlamydiales bacterium]|nr:DUF2165 domain-containing protein [Chlamydiales bacterium]NCF71756.1 DUF2165 family protein [Chlamydiales bacterium]